MKRIIIIIVLLLAAFYSDAQNDFEIRLIQRCDSLIMQMRATNSANLPEDCNVTLTGLVDFTYIIRWPSANGGNLSNPVNYAASFINGTSCGFGQGTFNQNNISAGAGNSNTGVGPRYTLGGYHYRIFGVLTVPLENHLNWVQNQWYDFVGWTFNSLSPTGFGDVEIAPNGWPAIGQGPGQGLGHPNVNWNGIDYYTGGNGLGVVGNATNFPIGGLPFKTWLGYTNDWHTPSNWCPFGVPSSTDSIFIPSTTPNNPTLSAAGFCNGARIEDTVVLNGNSLTINGTIAYDGGNIGRFRGDSLADLIIQGAGLTATIKIQTTNRQTRSFRNLTVDRSTGAALVSDTYIHGLLTLTQGNFNANNDLLLWASCNTCYAQIAPGGSGTISNNTNMWQATWFSGNEGWRHLSSSGVASNYGGQSNVGGLFGDNVVLRLFHKDTSNVWTFNKLDTTWYGVSSPSTPIHSAFAFYAGTVPGGKTITFPMRFGVIGEFSNQPYALRRDTLHNPFSGVGMSGWNFIGNPYPAGWRWDASVSDIQGNAYSVWRDSINNWGTWNGSVSTNGAYEIIPPMTGIFVKYTGSGTKLFDWTTSRITTDKQKLYSSKDGVNDLVRLRITGKGINDADELIVYHNSLANDGFGIEDVEENFSNVNLSLSSREGLKSLAYNIRNSISSEGSMIPVELKTKSAGQFTISPILENLLQIQTAELEDVFTGKIHNLMDGPYSFNATAFDRPERFVLHLNRKTSTSIHGSVVDKNPVVIAGEGLTVFVNFLNRRDEMAKVEITDMLGRVIMAPVNISTVQGLHSFKLDVAAGYYLVRVTKDSGTTTGKVFLTNN